MRRTIPTTVEILEHLIAFATVSNQSNLPLIDWVRDFLAGLGVKSQLVQDATGRKSNLLASIGPEKEAGIVLSGHTDVVPIDGQAWSSHPFELTAKGTRLYGRGSCDMKGFIAVALSRIAHWQAMQLQRPVHLMLSYDEEVGCLGAPSMIAAAQASIRKPAAVIVGEPTGMRIANQHKGIFRLRTTVKGVEAHSSLTHLGLSAVMLGAELIMHLQSRAIEMASNSRQSRRFEPPYTTLSVNRIEGGTSFNTLAGACTFEWDIRTLPGEDPHSTLERLAAFARSRLETLLKQGKQCEVRTDVLSEVPALAAHAGTAEELARYALSSREDSLAMPFATEAGQFQAAGWSTVVCGPGGIEQAHKPDEFVERAELDKCEQFLERLVARQCYSPL